MKVELPKTFRLELEPHERTNPFGLKLKTHFEEELTRLRQRNDALSLTEAQTAVLRGNIQFLKGFLSLWDPPLPVTATAARPVRVPDLGAKYG